MKTKILNTQKTCILLSALILSVNFAFAKTANKFHMIHVKDLTQMMKAEPAKVAVFDANSEQTRKNDGIIPGAKLLTSYDKYDVAGELPTDKTTKLVFYCANTKCTASHEAANRAIEAGFTNVNVMSDGIQGWKKSGQTVAKP
jgi:rhodanese-related sulfurtransferase